ncbi:MAG: DUF2490 domain-containing protein [Cyclobacteriaceae bacterium]|nr:DUF2490 domain-containing protein [Cyclobacteriaceae bacterium]
MFKWVAVLIFYVQFLGIHHLSAQTTKQVWAEYMLNYPFANSFNFENALTYSTLAGTPKWRAYDYSGTLEWSVINYVDLIAQMVVSYTNQTDTYNTLELRPIIGTRIYFTPEKRIQTRLLVRLEQRNFKNLETEEWESVFRPRARAEMIVPINKKTYYEDKLWYGITDVEVLFKTDDVEERFANRFRWRIGVGYRLNYNLRFEFLYMLQESKNAIGDDFETSDNIFRFRVKQYLRKSKPSTASGTGN